MRQTVIRAFAGIAILTMAAFVVQIYLAGIGAFGASGWDMHEILGSLIGIPILLLVVLALAGRLGRRIIGQSVLLLVLYIVQYSLVEIRGDAPYLSALHAVNALALMGVTGGLIRGAMRYAATAGAMRAAGGTMGRPETKGAMD